MPNREEKMYLRNKIEKNEDGFTLIEILVVILIIGILTSIAVPVFLNQRKVAIDSSTVSDVRQTALVIQTYFTDNPDAEFAPPATIKSIVKKSNPETVIRIMGDKDEFCVNGFNPNGKKYINETWDLTKGDTQPYIAFSSIEGGVGSITDAISTHRCYPLNRGTF